MDESFKELIAAVIAAHPGPWQQHDGYGDRGGRFTSITDANSRDVFDGEFGHLSEPVFNLLLNFPELADELGVKSAQTADQSREA